MLINRTHIVQHDVAFIVFLPVVFVSLPHVSTCLQEHIIVQYFVRMNIFTLPNKEPQTLQFVFTHLAAATVDTYSSGVKQILNLEKVQYFI